MKITEFIKNIHYVGVNDRTTALFENLWSLPYGISYNSYLIVDDKIALVDPVEEGFGERLIDNIEEIIGDREIDYLVINHMEPDHSSAIKRLRIKYPKIEVIGNSKTLSMLEGYYGITSNTIEIKEGESISLGTKSLSFYFTPMVHWPETMVTYCPEERVIFSSDAFGAFGALNGGVVDHQLQLDHIWDEMRRYYACIVGKYGAPVQRALQKLQGLEIATICPAHGPIWQKEIDRVMGIYDQFSRYRGEKGVVVAYCSMYGNTELLAEKIIRELAAHDVGPIAVHNLSTADISMVIRDVFKYDSLIVGSPTYNGALFPPLATLLKAIESRGIPHRNFACFSSYTWAGAVVKSIKAFAETMKWDIKATPIEMKQGYNSSYNEVVGKFVSKFIE